MLKAAKGKVIVQMVEANKISKGGLHLPNRETQPIAKVIHSYADSVYTNMIVVFSPYAGTKVTVDDDEFIILDEKDILAFEE